MKKTLLVVMAALSSLAVMAQWNDNPADNTLLSPVSDDVRIWENETHFTKDGVTYNVSIRPLTYLGELCYNLYYQVVEKDGTKRFADEGLQITKNVLTRSYTMTTQYLFVDKDGNTIIASADARHSTVNEMALSYTLYKISPAGEFLWGEEGIDLENSQPSGIVTMMKMLQLEDESYVFAWAKGNSILGVEVQRISKDGDFLWEKPIELKNDNTAYSDPYLTNAGNNQFNLVFTKSAKSEVYVRKYDFDGEPLWANDTKVYDGGFNLQVWTNLKVISHPDGGLFLTWHDDRFSTNFEKVYASYVKPDGSLGFASSNNGLRLNYAEGIRSFRPQPVYNAENESLYVIWEGDNSNQSYRSVVAQKVSITGELEWGPEGVLIMDANHPESMGDAQLQLGTDGSLLIAYIRGSVVDNNPRLFATLLDKEGKLLWGDTPVELSTAPRGKYDIVLSPLIDNQYWIAGWDDARRNVSSHRDYYLQRINTAGALGGATAIPSVKVDVSEENGVTRIYNLSGQQINALQRGINIVKQGSKVEKIFVK